VRALACLFQTQQQVAYAGEGSPFGSDSGGQHVTVVPQLIAPLDDQGQSVVVTGGQLVAAQDDDLGAAHLFLTTTTITQQQKTVKDPHHRCTYLEQFTFLCQKSQDVLDKGQARG
jgi:hypothetical protein